MNNELLAVVAHIRKAAQERENWSIESSTPDHQHRNAEIAMTLYKLALEIALGEHLEEP